MKYPQLYNTNVTKELLTEFRGLNQTSFIPDNQFNDMKNMSSNSYPVASPREKRTTINQYPTCNGMIYRNGLIHCTSDTLYHEGEAIGPVEDSRKQFISMGAYLLVFPDKTYYHTKTKEYGSLNNTRITSGDVSYTLVKQDGSSFASVTSGTVAPASPVNGAVWCDTNQVPNVLKQYSETQDIWVTVATSYIKVSAPGIGEGFNKGDGITMVGSAVAALNNAMVLQEVATDYIIVIGLLNQVTTQTEALTIKRECPDMEYFTESQNRIWGCSTEKNEIYACKLGDPFNWNVFQGISTDSYAVSVGTDGPFTGAITYNGYVLFFKENYIHKLFGTKPANYQLVNSAVRGVQLGSHNSLCICNETLFYKSSLDVCAYSGAEPVTVSKELGTTRYHQATGAAFGKKYYISMVHNEITTLFVYDTTLNAWYKEDDVRIQQFLTIRNNALYLEETKKSLVVMSEDISDLTPYVVADYHRVEKECEWYVETGEIGLYLPNNKYLSRLELMANLEKGSKFAVHVMYDGSNHWDVVYQMVATRKKTLSIPMIPMRCDHFKLRFIGNGACKLYHIVKHIESGGI